MENYQAEKGIHEKVAINKPMNKYDILVIAELSAIVKKETRDNHSVGVLDLYLGGLNKIFDNSDTIKVKRQSYNTKSHKDTDNDIVKDKAKNTNEPRRELKRKYNKSFDYSFQRSMLSLWQ